MLVLMFEVVPVKYIVSSLNRLNNRCGISSVIDFNLWIYAMAEKSNGKKINAGEAQMLVPFAFL